MGEDENPGDGNGDICMGNGDADGHMETTEAMMMLPAKSDTFHTAAGSFVRSQIISSIFI